MHEMLIASQLLQSLLDAAGQHDATRVVSATLRVGTLSCVNGESLRFGFLSLSQGTIAEGCDLKILRTPAEGECSKCGWTGEVTDPFLFPCPRCEESAIMPRGGREFTLESADIE